MGGAQALRASPVLVAGGEETLGEGVELGLRRGPAPALLVVECNVLRRVEGEALEVFEADSVLTIAEVAVPEVDDLTSDESDAAVDGAMERDRPFPVMPGMALGRHARRDLLVDV